MAADIANDFVVDILVAVGRRGAVGFDDSDRRR
jgi:hypothetical protein